MAKRFALPFVLWFHKENFKGTGAKTEGAVVPPARARLISVERLTTAALPKANCLDVDHAAGSYIHSVDVSLVAPTVVGTTFFRTRDFFHFKFGF